MRTLSDYSLIAGLILSILAAWLALQQTPDQQWLLPASLAAAAAVLLLRSRVSGLVARLWIATTSHIRLWSRAAALLTENAQLAEDVSKLETRLREAKGRAVDGYWAGLEEGMTRAAAAAISPRGPALPLELQLAPGEDEPTIVGRSPRPASIRRGGRATLVVVGTRRPVGVLVIRDVTPEGVVVMTCIDQLLPSFWASPDTTRLDAFELIPYDFKEHHRTRAIIPGEEDLT